MYTGKFIHCIGASVLMLGLVSCGSDDSDEPSMPQAPAAQNGVEFLATINAPIRSTDTAFESGDAISVWAVAPVNGAVGSLKSSGNYADNVRYNYNGSRFVAASSNIDKEEGERLSYYAVYPYASTNKDRITFSAKTDQTTRASYSASDLCAARTGLLATNTVDLTFNHAMAQIIIDVDPSMGTVTGIDLQNLYISAVLDLNAYTCTASGSKSTVKMSSNGLRSYRAIVSPQQMVKDARTAIIHTSNGDVSWNVEEAYNLEPGHSMSFMLVPTGSGEAVTFSGQIKPWEEI